jgi:hypothetical protein
VFRIALAFVCIGLLLGTPVASGAVGEGSARVIVLDAAGDRPIANARILLIGPSGGIGYTAKDGALEFAGIPPGHYKVSIFAPGYTQVAQVFDVGPGQAVDVTVTLSRLGMKTIASVTVRPRISAGANRADAQGALASTNGGLSSALSNLPAVASTATGASIYGLGQGGTLVNVDGAPVAGAGGSAALSTIGLDLFHSVTAEPIGTTGSAGIDLSTDNPTLAFSASGRSSLDGLGGYGGIFATTGTIGSVGFVAKAVGRSVDGPLQGAIYQDESGLTYSHNDEADGTGILAKVRAPFSQNDNVLAEASWLSLQLQPACAIASGGTPCGVGPGNKTLVGYSDSMLRYEHLFPNANLNFTLSNSTQGNQVNDLERIINNIASPYESSLSTVLSYDSLHFDSTTPAGDFSLDATTQRTSASANYPQATQTSFFSTYDNVSIADQVSLGSGQALRIDVNAPISGTKLGGKVAFDFAGSGGSAASVVLRVSQPSQPPLTQFPISGNLYDPASAAYDCLHQQVFANGLSSSATIPSDTGATLAYKLQAANWAFEAQASHDLIVGGLVPTVTLGAPVGPNAISPSILAAFDRFYATPGVCGVPVSLLPSSFVVDTPVEASLAYNRVTVSAAKRVSGVVVAPYVQFTDAEYSDNGARARVPFVPTFRGGLFVDGSVKSLRTELLGYLSFIGSNNPQGLPPHLELSLGTTTALMNGALSLGISNAGNARAYKFASSAYAAPLPNGIIPIATPLAPRTFFATFNVNVGTRASPQRIDALAALAAIAQPSQDVFNVSFSQWSGQAPVSPFEPDLTMDSCTPEAISTVRATLGAMRERVQTGGAPSSQTMIPSLDPQFGVSLVEHVRGDQISFSIYAKNGRTAQRVAGCVHIQFATVAQLESVHAYIPSEKDAKAAFAFFSPAVGWYRPLGTEGISQQNASTVDLDPMPASPPNNPFVLRESCPKQFEPFASTVLASLSRDLPALLAGKSPQLSRYYRLRLFAAGRHSWARIDFLDAFSVEAVETCAHVAGISSAELSAAGFVGDHQGLEFATQIGLFEKI